MHESPNFERVARDLGGVLVDATPLEGGSSASVWRLDIDISMDQRRRVAYRSHRSADSKQSDPNIAVKEFGLLQVLSAQGMAVAEPLRVIEAEQALITGWVDGTTDVSPEGLEAALDQMVDFLVELHRLDPAMLTHVPLGTIEDPVASLPRYLPATAVGSQLAQALESSSVAAPTNNPVLIHGDYWPGNVLWHDGGLAAVIDWEDAVLGDPLADLACARVELLCQYDAAAMHSFTEAYLSATQLDTTALGLWECYVSATALKSMHGWGLDAAEESRRRTLTTRFFERAATDLVMAPE